MRVLVLNNFFTGWTGSEIVALEVAEHFGAVCSSFIASEQMRSALPEWRPLDQIDLRDFDFVWAQHHAILPLLDRLSAGDRRPFIAVASLSPYEPNERLPSGMLDAYADVLVANSQETAEVIGGSPLVLQNAAPGAFHFERGALELRRVLIVSNHVPPEMREAARSLAETGIDVRTIGARDTPRRISPADIAAADLVVSIGKTVRYALASGTPVYVYDHFGGDGYLTPENYPENEHFNFSGRPRRRRLEPAEIATEILTGYKAPDLPPQPTLSGFLDAIRPSPRTFERHPDLAGAAAMAEALGRWVARAYIFEDRAAKMARGEYASWSWLAMCLRRKIARAPARALAKMRLS